MSVRDVDGRTVRSEGRHMGAPNRDPIATFSDGSHLLVSTQHSKEGSFSCELYMASPGFEGCWDLRVVSDYFEASTCLQAQEFAYSCAQRLYPGTAVMMKRPPYLIWLGPGPRTRM